MLTIHVALRSRSVSSVGNGDIEGTKLALVKADRLSLSTLNDSKTRE
jgi:hypothetical protein